MECFAGGCLFYFRLNDLNFEGRGIKSIKVKY